MDFGACFGAGSWRRNWGYGWGYRPSFRRSIPCRIRLPEPSKVEPTSTNEGFERIPRSPGTLIQRGFPGFFISGIVRPHALQVVRPWGRCPRSPILPCGAPSRPRRPRTCSTAAVSTWRSHPVDGRWWHLTLLDLSLQMSLYGLLLASWRCGSCRAVPDGSRRTAASSSPSEGGMYHFWTVPAGRL